MTAENSLGIRGYDYVEFYVGSAKMVAYWFARAMGFKITGYAGPETGVKDKISFYLTLNKIQLVVTSAIQPENYEISSFVNRHGDGVKRWTMSVDNVETAFDRAAKNGAVPVQRPTKLTDEQGTVEEASIRIFDSTEICFVNRDRYKGIFKPGYKAPFYRSDFSAKPTGLQFIDHIVGNVRENEMDFWSNYFNKSFDFETFVHFGPGDISTKYSALLSKVVRSKDNKIKNPINEPYQGVKKSQIEEYIDAYRGSGIQHMAIATDNIIETIRAMRENGIEFLTVPKTYYDILRERKLDIAEDLNALQELGILCDYDRDGKGYLLQLFTKPIGDRPTFFFEIIQRKRGSESFGQGNFQALFESIERDQMARGTFDRDK